ncbi:uncharacterized protein B0J16DRAFT_399881 [Fusarium flagelliforme]|uniref:uncharacterized protein n=1 Tax=Fusarium flagelliforme TaxID=2675880 RepID=UPI001E8EBA09|nr:uncharacterized protein B0J16DRAFT_399881 [Fusarium flagelliforme]KAH7186019.1 hypothetical protein B0J16DRAFT_399881 [Fusarium flagelliforme]
MPNNNFRSTASGSTVSTSIPSSDQSCSSSTQDWPLNKDEDDTLIPSSADVQRTFCNGTTTWGELLRQANEIPSGLWPADALDPYIILVDVPSLPEQLPRRDVIYGRPCWELPLDVGGTMCEGHNPQNNVAHVHGRRVIFRLRTRDPICCNICLDAASYPLGVGSETTSSLAILVMCWSYIFSVRLLEMQGRQRQAEHVVDLDLEGASPSLIRWLCAILSPQMGWRAKDQGPLPPWATSFATDVNLSIKASIPAIETRLPPSSSEATDLLIQLCQLFDLGAKATDASNLESMPPYKASFLATLVLPFYNFMKLQSRLPPPRLTRTQKNGTFRSSHKQIIRGYFNDIRYFMTLSIDPVSIGSIIWSIFWQPDVDCNLVSPWLASILDTLEPVIKQKRFDVLVKVFLSRRPRVAIWWVALFLLGDLALLDWIGRYTVNLEEKYGFGSLSPPDPMVSAWTGSRQSFLDLDRDSLYPAPDDLVSRADLLRCRFDLKLQDSSSNLSWRPFGYIQKKHVELELWPQLETRYSRKYHSFTWYLHHKQPVSDKGFRVCTGRNVRDVPDNLELSTTSSIDSPVKDCQCIKVRPSKESTLRMMSFLVEDVAGSRDWVNADLPGKHEQFRWLRDWEGVDGRDGVVVENEEESVKSPSWFLGEWIRDKYH